MPRKKGLTEDQLAKMARSEIDDSISYYNTELSSRRAKAIDYYNGNMRDLKVLPRRSSVTSHDLSDAIGWILPGLMRVFCGGDMVVEYGPNGPEDEEYSQQATDYINYMFWNEWEGAHLLQNATLEALQMGNGILKCYWDAAPDYKLQDVSGLSDDGWAMLAQADDVEVLQHTEEVAGLDQQTGQPMLMHSGRIRWKDRTGDISVESLPPEDFLINRDACSLADATFMAHRRSVTRADLLKMGYRRSVVMKLAREDGDSFSTDEEIARDYQFDNDTRVVKSEDKMMEMVEIFECYLQADFDGDDHPEWRKVVMAGEGDERDILDNEEWADPLPFYDLCAMIVPHRWEGRSLLDELEDIQQIKTVLMRQTLDNLYAQNVPQRAVQLGGVANLDELMNPGLGGIVIEKIPGAVRDLTTPFVAQHSFTALAYFDEVAEKRTGVSRTSMALDPEALSNQSATSAAIAQTASYAKIELYARNIAIGLRRLFKAILKLVCSHQEQARVIRLRGRWVEMDPRSWNADMDCVIEVGLGSGSKDRDLMMLQQILQQQKEIVQMTGPFNPIAGIDKITNTLSKMVETAGIRNADSYFGKISIDEAKKWMAENMPKNDEPSDDIKKEMVKGQVAIQIEQAKMENQKQIEATKAQVNTAREEAQMQADLAVKRAELEAKAVEAQQKAQIDEKQKDLDMRFQMQKLLADIQIEREKMAQQRQIELLKLGVQAAETDEEGNKKPSVFDDMMQALANDMGRANTQIASQLAAMMQAQTEALLRAARAPKRIIRGSDGRAIGVETVEQ